MNEVTSRWLSPPLNRGALQKARPVNLLAQLVTSAAHGYLQVSNSSVSWSIYLDGGRITYASHTVQPFERLDLHLHRLGYQLSQVTAEARSMVEAQNAGQGVDNPDYRTICWLVAQRHLNPIEATTLVEGLVKEVLESFLLVREGTCEFIDQIDDLPKFCRLELMPLVDYCRQRLQSWQALGPQIWSPHQRPYLFSQTQSQQKISPELRQKLGAILKGFSFRHLAALLNKDELALAEGLKPYIANGVILLREPKPPFDQLPRVPAARTTESPPAAPTELTTASETELQAVVQPTPLPTPMPTAPVSGSRARIKQTYAIACIDDSPTILNEMRRFLNDESFDVYAINDPLKALIQVIRMKPDLILLDIGMPNIDGYKLCRLLRNHSLFATTPIIMVTGNTGIIDRAKAKFVGASDYLTKPFTKVDLLKTVSKHLT